MPLRPRLPIRLGLALALATPAMPTVAQEAPAFQVPTTNPAAVVRQKIAATDVEISYHRPRVKGRTIFGGLVPYGQVWRTGSDNATRLSFGTPVTLNGVRVEAGDYELFTIPGPSEWTVIIHADQRQWGSYTYDPAHDVVRFPAKPVRLAQPVESFTIGIDDVDTHSAVLNVSWEQTRVPIAIEVDVRETVVPRLEEMLRGEGRKPWFLAAMFYYENGLDIDRAVELIDRAVEDQPTHIGMLYRQALIHAEQGDTVGAVRAAERSLAGAQGSARELKEEYTRLNTALLDRLRAR